MKKAEMEEHVEQYLNIMEKVSRMERLGLIQSAVKLAVSAWDHIDGMMQYENRYADREFSTIPAIEIVLKYAPMLFEFEMLDHLETLLTQRRRIDNKTSTSLKDQLAIARDHLKDNHRLWNLIESQGPVKQRDLRQILGGQQDYWRSVCETWELMGMVRRVPDTGSYQVSHTTRMGEIITGKCPRCGSTAEAPKSMLLDPMTCPDCKQSVYFVFLSPIDSSSSEGTP